MARRGRIFINRFTSLDDLKGKQRSEPMTVLQAILANGGRFSVFDATADQKIAGTMTYIERESGWVRRVEGRHGYPWITIELTEAGRKALAS
jgi:hypothetical protein